MLVHFLTAEPRCKIHTTLAQQLWCWKMLCPGCNTGSNPRVRAGSRELPSAGFGAAPRFLSTLPECRNAEIDRQGTRQREPVWQAVSVTGTRQTYCWIRILNDFSSFSPLPVFFFPCPRICPPSRKSLFISDKAMGHAVIVGLSSRNHCSSGSAPLQTALLLHGPLPGLAAHTAQPCHRQFGCPLPPPTPMGQRCNRLPGEKLKSHSTCQSYLIQYAQRFFHDKS